MKRLYRSRKDKVFAGICGGLGEYFDIDPVIIRVATVILTVFGGFPIFIYIVAIFVIPYEPVGAASDESKAPGEKKTARKEPDPAAKEKEKERMEEHVKILGILYLALSALGIIAAVIIFSLLFGTGWVIGDHEAIIIIRIVGISVSGLLVLLSAPGIICGLGLLKKESWARILALVLGFINLINIPFGTALGIYTIWVMTNKETEELFNK